MVSDPTRRFSNRVENYVKYRPGYPPGIINLLQAECGLTGGSIVADVGSGTGLLAILFLKNGNDVFGVEPNAEMREAGEQLLQDYTHFHSIDGRAEDTTLPDGSVNFVTAGQAFHWFDREQARTEFLRILQPPGWIVLVWNERRITGNPFQEAYEELVQTYGKDYAEVNHRQVDESALGAFFNQGYAEQTFQNAQTFDFTGLRGRLLSSSYVPEAGDPGHEEMLTELEAIFSSFADHGYVTIQYDTRVYYGRVVG
ncbi:MAG TPA: class I SAM-dependent methyltransferase [Candidatus Lokiarchaeia archaeon]|nr:class I SAM-dependent methyltransferase [Candidatus Lokiarchaeia archaeon]